MVKKEIYKLLRMKTTIISIVIVFFAILFSLICNGEFGYDLSDNMITYSENNGEIINGKEGYEHNKEVATLYKGKVTDAFLKKLQKDYRSSTYVVVDDTKFYNATYRFFEDIARIEQEHYICKDEIWRKSDGIVYGFSGDWDAYCNVLEKLFCVFSFFVIIFASPVFTYEKECGMLEMIGTMKNGGEHFIRHKIRAVFIVVNAYMAVLLIFVSSLHFFQYGFANFDVSIQCSFEKEYITALLDCNLGQLALYKLIFGVVGCNVILLISFSISMLSRGSLESLIISIFLIWGFRYSIIYELFMNKMKDIILALFPVNLLNIDFLVKSVSSEKSLYIILSLHMIFYLCYHIILKKHGEGKLWQRNL